MAVASLVEIDDGDSVLFRADDAGDIKIVRQSPDERSSLVDANYVMLGIFEALAE